MEKIVIYFPIVLYFLYLFFEFYRTKNIKLDDKTSYILAGRRLTLPGFIATLVSTWYGGILGVGEFSFKYGISNWLVFGVPYYIAALIFAFFLSKKIRDSSVLTIPEQLEFYYNRKISVIGAIFILLQSIPSVYILIFGLLFSYLTGLPYVLSVIIGIIFSSIYIYKGGLKAISHTDSVQFILMYISFFIILITAYIKFGGISFLKNNLPGSHFTFSGGNSMFYILSWYIIALSTLIEPTFYQRVEALEKKKYLIPGILISIFFWIVFDFMTTFSGLYARAIIPNMKNAAFAYPELANQILPPFFKGIFYTGLFATIMSTIDSYLFISTVSIGNDILSKVRFFEKIKQKNYMGIGLLVSVIFSFIVSISSKSIINLWYNFGSIVVPALLVPVVSTYTKFRLTMRQAYLIMILAPLFSIFLIFYEIVYNGKFYNIEPILPGIIFSFFVWLYQIFMIKKEG